MQSSSACEKVSGPSNGTGANHDATARGYFLNERRRASLGYLAASDSRFSPVIESSIANEAITGLNSGARHLAEMHPCFRAARMVPGIHNTTLSGFDTAISSKEDAGNLAGRSSESPMTAKSHNRQATGLGSVATELSMWLELVCRAHDDLNVLVLQGSTKRQDFVGLLSGFAPKSGCRGRFGSCSVFSDSEDTISQLKHELSEAEVRLNCRVVDMASLSSPDQAREMGTYDIILAPVGIHLGINQLYVFRQLLAPKGHLALVSYCADPYEYIDWKSFVSAAGFYHIAASVDKPGSQLIISSIPTHSGLKEEVERSIPRL